MRSSVLNIGSTGLALTSKRVAEEKLAGMRAHNPKILRLSHAFHKEKLTLARIEARFNPFVPRNK
jgi:hypothetical protein